MIAMSDIAISTYPHFVFDSGLKIRDNKVKDVCNHLNNL